MDGNVMKMRAVAAIELPAGKAVELKPGGYHVMLMDLKAALPKDTTVPLTLVFKDAKGVESKVENSRCRSLRRRGAQALIVRQRLLAGGPRRFAKAFTLG